MGGLVVLIIIGTTVWVGVDTSGRDFSQSKFARSTAQWVIGSLFLWIVAFPAYLALRGRAPRKTARGRTSPTPGTWMAAPAASVPPPSQPPLSASKRCPDCAESVRAEARKCRFCGHAFALVT